MGCNQEIEFELLFLTEFNEHVTKFAITREVLKYTGIELSHSVYIAAKITDEATKLNETIP